MKKSNTMGGAGDDQVPVEQELRRLLKAGLASVTVFNIIQVGDRPMAPDQAARLAREFLPLLSRADVQSEPSGALLPGSSHQGQARAAVFRYDGRDTWEIGLSGHVCLHRDAVGLHQLHRLLLRPKERISVWELAEVRGQQIVINQSCSEDVADAQALVQYRAQRESLEDQLTMAQETGNSERASELAEEIDALQRQSSCAQSCRGTRRRLGDQNDKLRKRVYFTIRSSLQKIIGQDPELGEHLLASIKLGFDCGYFPVTSVDWTL